MFVLSHQSLKFLASDTFQILSPGVSIILGELLPYRPTFSGVLWGQPAVKRLGCPLIVPPPGQIKAAVSKNGRSGAFDARVARGRFPSPMRSGNVGPVLGVLT